MQSECLSFTRVPHTTQLFLDYLYNFPRVAQFYIHPPLSTDWYAKEACRISYPGERRERVARALERRNRAFGSGTRTHQNIERLRNGAVAVVTGQQVGLFGGPLFSILKAITAVRIAHEASALGVDAVPVFWLATEDHDSAEIDHLTLPGRTVRVSAVGQAGAPVSEVRLGEDVVAAVAALRELHGDSEVIDWVAEFYKPGATFGDAFGRLFARIFAEHGVILLDASDPELHDIAKPLYRRSIEEADVSEQLIARGQQLQAAGYHEQVKVTRESTLLFAKENGIRTPIHRANGDFEIRGRRTTSAELLARIEDNSARFSPNVLLRPVVQDWLLPTLAYVGGPAEIAYFAQAAVVYENFAGRVTPVLPRLSATIVDPRSTKLLEKYGLRLSDLLGGELATRELVASRSLPREIHRRFDTASESLERNLSEIRKALSQLDPTLVKASEKSSAKMRYQLERLRGRTARAEMQRHADVARHAQQLSSTLFPHDGLQERTLPAVSALATFGEGLLHSLFEASHPSCPDHQVLTLAP